MDRFRGKTAFITGGASGIGLGIAKAAAQAGMNIVLADLRRPVMDVALQWFRENGTEAISIELNVTDREAYAKATGILIALLRLHKEYRSKFLPRKKEDNPADYAFGEHIWPVIHQRIQPRRLAFWCVSLPNDDPGCKVA